MKALRASIGLRGRVELAGASLVFALALGPASGAGPAPLDSTRRAAEQAKLKVLEDKLEALRKDLASMEEEHSTVLGELQRLNLQIRMAREEIQLLRARLELGYREIDRNLGEVRSLEASIRELRPLLQRRAVALYKLGRMSYLRLLLSVEEPRELTRAYRYVSRLARSDGETMKRFRAEQTELEARKAELLSQTKDMLETKRAVEKANQTLEGRRALKVSLLEEIGRRRDMAETVLSEVEASREELSKLIDWMSAGEGEAPSEVLLPMRIFQGDLEWPVEGKVSTRFGRQRHPRFQTITVQNGIEIEASPGTPVRAVYDGKVVFASWFKGYGKLLILSHPRRVHTLYGYLQDVKVSEGDTVTRGQEVALAGEGGPFSEPGLYFEIRDEGKPVDPELWLSLQK